MIQKPFRYIRKKATTTLSMNIFLHIRHFPWP